MLKRWNAGWRLVCLGVGLVGCEPELTPGLGITVLVCGVMSLPLLMKWSSAKARVKWE